MTNPYIPKLPDGPNLSIRLEFDGWADPRQCDHLCWAFYALDSQEQWCAWSSGLPHTRCYFILHCYANHTTPLMDKSFFYHEPSDCWHYVVWTPYDPQLPHQQWPGLFDTLLNTALTTMAESFDIGTPPHATLATPKTEKSRPILQVG